MAKVFRDPIHQDGGDGKWYFWNEYWADKYGPFETREEADNACMRYRQENLGIDDRDKKDGEET